MKKLLFVLVFVVLGVFLTAFLFKPQTPDQPIDVFVTLEEYKIVLSRTNLPVGVPIRFIFKNMGALVHEAVLEKAGVDDEPLEIAGEESEVEDIQPGQDPSAVWTIDEPGKYQLACHIPGHYEDGMFSTFYIRPGGDLVSLLFENAVWIAGGIVVALLILVGAALTMRRRAAVVM